MTKEVNQDKNFSQLRQVYNSLILATWYKKKIKDSILEQVYANKNKVAGVNIDDPKEKRGFIARYLQAFKKGVYNYIKEERDTLTEKTIPRKYFSGGETLINLDSVMNIQSNPAMIANIKNLAGVIILSVSLLITPHIHAQGIVKSQASTNSEEKWWESPVMYTDPVFFTPF